MYGCSLVGKPIGRSDRKKAYANRAAQTPPMRIMRITLLEPVFTSKVYPPPFTHTSLKPSRVSSGSTAEISGNLAAMSRA